MALKKQHRAVVDTNIFLSGLLNDTEAPAKLIKLFKNDGFSLLISEDILKEYTGVILEFENNVLVEQAENLILTILNKTIFIYPEGRHEVCRDVDDNKFIECAVAGDAAYIVTKNIRHFPKKEYKGIKIVRIGDFLKVLEK